MNLRDYGRRMQRRAKRQNDRRASLLVRVALVADQALVTSTPVDTGRARSNWVTSLNGPVLDENPEGSDRSAQGAINQFHAAVGGIKPGDSIYITNNVPYIQPLNEGHSAQAPPGFVQTALNLAVNSIVGIDLEKI